MKPHPSLIQKRQGLTLIELLVVLTILIALGGIVISSLPGLLGKTESATASANVSELDSAIRRNLIVNQNTIGNRFDSLVVGGSGEVPSYIGGSEYFSAIKLSDSEVEALEQVGITELIPAAPSVADATFESHLGEPISLGTDTNVCILASAFVEETMQRIWNLEPADSAKYLVFGLGTRSSLVGGSETALFPEAPVHFSDSATSGPKKMYSRYLVVVELKAFGPQSSESTSAVATNISTANARYVGIAIPSPQGLRGIQQELRDAYSAE